MSMEYCVEINSNLNWDSKEEMIEAIKKALEPTSIVVMEKSIRPQMDGCKYNGFFNFSPITPEGRLVLCGIEYGLGMVIDKIATPEKISSDIKELLEKIR